MTGIRQPLLRYSLAIVAGLAIGGVSALYMARLVGSADVIGGTVEVDSWRGDFAIGSSSADPYTRARVARHGLLALARSEAVYLTRAVDGAGRRLTDDCSYRLSGGNMPARWWSVTLYDSTSFLPRNDDNALSYDATRAGGKDWSAIVSDRRPGDGAAWISSRNAGQFDLTLRLYIPDAALIETPEQTLRAPVIERLSCTGDAA